MQRICTLMAVAFYLLVTNIAFGAEDYTFSEGYWVDADRTASLDEAMQANFTPTRGTIALGYVPHALWIKLTIDGQLDRERLAILVRPMFLRQVELYDPEFNGMDAPPVLSGRDAPLAETNHVGLENGFIIPPSAKSRDVYLRIMTTTSLTADVAVQPFELAEYNSFVTAGFLAIYFAFLLGFCLWSVVAWGVRRDHLYGLFALRQLYSLAHIFVFFGSLRFFLSGSLTADTREVIYSVICCTIPSVAGYFDVRLISDFGGSRRLRRGIYILLCMPVVTMPLVMSGQTQAALQVASLAVAVQMVAMSAFAFSTKVDMAKPFQRKLIFLLRFGFVVMAAVIVVPNLMYQNFVQSSVPLFKIVFLHAVISTIILFAILSIRSRQRDFSAREAQHLVEVKDAELVQESSRRLEKERFLAMLTHELRNPLSVIELLPSTDPESAATVRKAARDMADVIERVEQSERIDSGQLQVEMTEFDLSALIRRVAENHTARDLLSLDCTSLQMVVSDADLVQRIVVNLLDNAAKYSMTNSQIRMALIPHVRNGHDGIQFSVSNEIGRAGPADPERVFTKYYRAKGRIDSRVQGWGCSWWRTG